MPIKITITAETPEELRTMLQEIVFMHAIPEGETTILNPAIANISETTEATAESAPAKGKRGRPPGAKNKGKPAVKPLDLEKIPDEAPDDSDEETTAVEEAPKAAATTKPKLSVVAKDESDPDPDLVDEGEDATAKGKDTRSLLIEQITRHWKSADAGARKLINEFKAAESLGMLAELSNANFGAAKKLVAALNAIETKRQEAV
jgi:hypothetical protein